MKRTLLGTLLVAGLLLAASNARAAIILDGTDANDHGSVSGTTNQAGWEYMQRALENLAPTVAGKPKVVTILGIDSSVSSQARNAINSAFLNSSLPGAGWTHQFIDGVANINAHLSGGLVGTGLLYIPTVGNSSGDMADLELGAINGGTNPGSINAFLGAGGSLFAMGESPTTTGVVAYGWLQALLPGSIYADIGGGGHGSDVTLTAAGATAFPGLTNADLAGADPWHGHFSGNLGTLQVLGTALEGNNVRNVVIGLGTTGGTIDAIPEPISLAIWSGIGLVGAAGAWRRRRLAK